MFLFMVLVPLLLMVFAFRFRRNAIRIFAHGAVYEEDKTPDLSFSSISYRYESSYLSTKL